MHHTFPIGLISGEDEESIHLMYLKPFLSTLAAVCVTKCERTLSCMNIRLQSHCCESVNIQQDHHPAFQKPINGYLASHLRFCSRWCTPKAAKGPVHVHTR